MNPRGTALPLAVVLGLALAPGCAQEAPSRPQDLAAAVREFVSGQARSPAGYAVPVDPEATARGLLAGRPGQGYHLSDGPGGTRLGLPDDLPDPRGGGMYALHPGGRQLAIEVPHPLDDLDTDLFGAELATSTQAAYLLVAGARRDLAEGRADVAHETASLFHAMHLALARRGVPAVQLHGFAAESLPGVDVVVSSGTAAPSPLATELADGIEESGLRTCRAWREQCGRLEGRTNVQGLASVASGATFVHVEVTRRVRADAAARDSLVGAMARVIDTVRPWLPTG